MRQYIAAHDAETAQHVSNLCGTATVKTESSDSNGRKSFGHIARKLLTPEEVREIREIEQVVFIGNMKPMLTRIRPYWERPELKDRFNDNPYHDGTPGRPLTWPLQV